MKKPVAALHRRPDRPAGQAHGPRRRDHLGRQGHRGREDRRARGGRHRRSPRTPAELGSTLQNAFCDNPNSRTRKEKDPWPSNALSIVKPDAVAGNAVGGDHRSTSSTAGCARSRPRWCTSRSAGRGLLRRPQGAPVLRRPGPLHDLRPVRGPGARRRERHRREPRAHGRRPTRRRRPRAPSARSTATDIEKNAVHGSGRARTAKYEIGFFFRGAELAASEWTLG